MTIDVPAEPQAPRPTSTFTWSSGNLLTSDPFERSMSLVIFGYESVIAILKQAFALGLSRSVEWDISNVEAYLQPSYSIAARVFRRGVPVKDQRQEILQQAYEITFCSDLDEVIFGFDERDLLIVDSEVAKFWWNRLPKGYRPIDFSESRKDVEALVEVVSALRERNHFIRDVVVVGGGVAGDMVGFACGLLGIRCHFVPTTLLSMVDSSIGGKVGINFEPWGKNQVGLFYPPASVKIWPGWLATLAESELQSGAAEALKHALLSGDRRLWQNIIMIIRNNDWNQFRKLIAEIVAVKSSIVARDPFEQGERAILNFGHTLGHAIEILMSRRGKLVPHGACVALGMVHALRVSKQYFGFETRSIISELLEANILPTGTNLQEILSLPKDEILKLIQSDKKNDGNAGVQFILLEDWGKPRRGNNGRWQVEIPMANVASEIEMTFAFLNNQNRDGS